MIIGIDATRANKPEKTGVEWYSYHLIRELVRLPTKHTYRLYFNSQPETGLQKLGPNVEYRILRWPLPYLWTQARLSWEMLMNPPDLLFIPAQIIPVIHPARTVTTVHDVAYKPYPKSYTFRSRLYLDLAARMARALPAILTVSQFSKKEIIKHYGMQAEKIHVTPLGLTHETYGSTIIPPRLNVRRPYLLYVGRLERKKNIRAMVESFNLMAQEAWGKELQLVLVGTRGHGWEEIKRVIDRSPAKNRIRVIGWVSEEEKHALFARADLFILLSAYEGFGLPLLEAMDAGVPIIASDQASLPEVAGDAAFLVRRGDTRAVAEAARKIMFEPALKRSLIERGKARVRQFTWRNTALSTTDVIEKLLKIQPWLSSSP